MRVVLLVNMFFCECFKCYALVSDGYFGSTSFCRALRKEDNFLFCIKTKIAAGGFSKWDNEHRILNNIVARWS